MTSRSSVMATKATTKWILEVSELLDVGLILTHLGVYFGVKTFDGFLCFVVIVRVRVYFVDVFVFFVLRHW